MIDVLIVEDNKLALDYIKNVINWEDNGFRITAAAPDGEEGLKRYLAFRPQLIITDTQMPLMSGVKLAERIRHVDKGVRIIFLSAYQEFSYARSALDLGISYYLLKHELNESSLIETLKKVKILINEGKALSRFKLENNIIENILGNSSAGEICGKDDTRYVFIAFERDRPLDMIQGFFHIAELDAKHVKSVLIIDEDVVFDGCKRKYLDNKDKLRQRFFSRRSVVLNSIFLDTPEHCEVVAFDNGLFRNAIDLEDIDVILKFIDSSYYSIIKQRDYPGLLRFSRELMGVLRTYASTDNLSLNGKFELLTRPYLATSFQFSERAFLFQN